MFLALIGIILFIFSFRIPAQLSRTIDPAKIKSGLRLGALLLIVLGMLGSCVKQIDAGYIGIQSLFGKIQERTLVSGLNIINPLIDVKQLDVRTQNYTMSGVHDEGDRTGDDAIRVLTKDGLEVTIDLSILYRVSAGSAPKMIREIGIDYKDKIVRPMSRTKIRDNAVYYDAIELYSTKRDDFQQKIFKGLESEFLKRGLILENLLVRNITLPQAVKLTIESKINVLKRKVLQIINES